MAHFKYFSNSKQCSKSTGIPRFVYLKLVEYTEPKLNVATIQFFAPVQKVKIALTKFKLYKKVQGFVETLQIMSFQNVL